MKKSLALFLILLQLLTLSSSFSFCDYNYLYSLDIYNKTKEQLQQKKNSQYVISDKDIYDYIVQIGGQRPHNTQNDLINPSTYRNYKVIAYGEPFGDKYESFKIDPNFKTKEYRYLGFDFYGNKISNDQFINDFEISSLPTSRNYVAKIFAEKWDHDIKPDTAQTNRLLYSHLLNDDKRENEYFQTNYSVNTLLGAKIGEYKSYVELMAEPTYLQEGVLRLWHRGRKGVYYDTMRTVRMDNLSINTTMSVDRPSITFEPTATGIINANITVKSNLMFTDTYGQNESEYFKQITQVVQSDFNEFSGENELFSNESMTIKRQLKPSEKSSTYTIPINPKLFKEGESKTYDFLARTIVKTAYDNTFISDVSKISIVISKGSTLKSQSANVDFKIYIDDVDYTDSVYKVADLEFKEPVSVTLKDVSSLNNINPKYYYWINSTTKEILKAGGTQDKEYKFNIDSKNKGNFLDINNNISFSLKIGVEGQILYESPIHNTTFKVVVPTPIQEPPLADIFARTKSIYYGYNSVTVHAGDRVILDSSKSYSKDKNSSIDQFNINTEGFTNKTSSKSTKTGYFGNMGTFTQTVDVVDSNGNKSQNSAQVKVTVIEPDFKLCINHSGKLKENRVVTFDLKDSVIPAYYPLDFSTIKWEIITLEGEKPIIGEWKDEKDVIKVQFTKKGKYKVKATGTIKSLDASNTKTYSASTELTFDIEEDEKPITRFVVSKHKLRDPNQDNKVYVNIIDKSYSPDGDFLDDGRLSYRYDSNGDGSFEGEKDVFITASFNESLELILDKNLVGKFRFFLTRKEKSPTEYIKWTETFDRWSDSDADMIEEDKILQVLNTAPTVLYDVDNLKDMTFVVATDFTGEKLMNLQSQMDKLKMYLIEKKINPNFIYFNDQKSFGKRELKKYKYVQKGTIKYSFLTGYGNFVTSNDEVDYYTYPGEYWANETPELPMVRSYYGKVDIGKGWNVERDNGGAEYFHSWDIPINGNIYRHEVGSGMISERGGAISSNYSGAEMSVNGYFSPEVVGSKTDEIKSFNMDKLKTLLSNGIGEKNLLIYSTNSYALGDLRADFVDYCKSNEVSVYTNLSYFKNPFEVKSVQDFYSAGDVAYVLYSDGKAFKYDKTSMVYSPTADFYEGASYTERGNNDFWYLNNIFVGKTIDSNDRTIDITDMSKSLQELLSKKSENEIFGQPHDLKSGSGWRSNGENKAYDDMRASFSPCRYIPYVIDGNLKIRGQLLEMTKGGEFYTFDYINKEIFLDSGVSEIIAANVMSLSRTTFQYTVYYKKSGNIYKVQLVIDSSLANGVRTNQSGKRVFNTHTGVSITPMNHNIIKADDNMVYSESTAYRITDQCAVIGYKSLGENKIVAEDGTAYIPIEGILVPIKGKSDVFYDGKYYRYVYDGKLYISYIEYDYDRRSYNSGFTYINWRDAIISMINGIGFSDNGGVLIAPYDKNNINFGSTDMFYGEILKCDDVTYAKGDKRWGLVSTRSGIYLLNTQGGSKMLEKSVVSVTSDMRGLGELFKSNQRNKILSDINILADTINNDIGVPYYNKTAYILLGESIETAMMYVDYENDPVKDMKFNFIHDETVFENNVGKDPTSGLGLKNPISKFNFTGLYKGSLKISDNPTPASYSKENIDNTDINIYVHRKPTAKGKYSLIKSGGGFNLALSDDGSYDLDRKSTKDMGITQWKWLVYDNDTGKMSQYNDKSINIDTGKYFKYEVTLFVRDEMGAWSDPYEISVTEEDIRSIELSYDIEPVDVGLSLERFPTSENIRIQNITTNYDKPLVLEAYLEDDKKNRILIHRFSDNNTSGLVNWTSYDYYMDKRYRDGNYKIVIIAIDKEKPTKTKALSKEFYVVTPISLQPSVPKEVGSDNDYEISTLSSKYTDEVILNIYDLSGTLIRTQAMSGSNNSIGKKFITTVRFKTSELKSSKLKYEFIGKIKSEPEKTQTVYATSTVKTISIDDIKIWGEWNRWDGGKDIYGVAKSNNPRRFLSFEKIYVEVKTSGSPDYVEIDMCDELKAMRYKDDKGNVYKYKDFVGKEVVFPLRLKKVSEGLYRNSYILPLADSTLDIADNRLKEPYTMTVKCVKGSSVIKKIIDKSSKGGGIEITGNIYDHIYLQKK